MSTCGLCGQQLLPGMGHACSTVGAPRVTFAPPAPRIPTLKTWRDLERLAAEQHLSLSRTPGCVTVETLHRVPYVTITTDQIDRDEDADRVVRAALEAALGVLRSLYP